MELNGVLKLKANLIPTTPCFGRGVRLSEEELSFEVPQVTVSAFPFKASPAAHVLGLFQLDSPQVELVLQV